MARRNPVITLPDGRVFPEYDGKALSWSIGLYMTHSESEQGYPKAKAVIRAMQEHRPEQLEKERREMVRASFGKMFGHNAKKELDLIESITGRKSNPRGRRNPAGSHYKPEKRGDFWYVASYNLTTGERDKWGGMNTSFTTREEALKYANQINKANRYPAANPRGRRTMKRSRNSSAGHKWGVYCKGTLAYVSSSKPDCTQAKRKLSKAGFGVCTVKKVLPNPVSGKVPVVGWREQFKKASRVTGRKKNAGFGPSPSTTVRGSVADALKRRWIPGRKPSVPKPAPKERSRIVRGRRANPFKKYAVNDSGGWHYFMKLKDAKTLAQRHADHVNKAWHIHRVVRGVPTQVVVATVRPSGKRNPGMGPARGVSSRAVSGRVGRQLSQYSPGRGYMGRNAGIGTRSVASGGRLRNPGTFYEVIVGNIGKVHEGNNAMKAYAVYNKYVKQSKSGTGRAAGEDVSLWKDNEPIKEHYGTASESNPRRRNAASILRRRSNPVTEYVLWDPIQKNRYRQHGQGSYGAVYMFPTKKEAEDTAAIINRQTGRAGSTRLSVVTHAVARGRRKHNPSRSANPRKGYVVQVGNTVAWVGKLASDAQKVMRKLIAAGFKSVKGFQAKLLGAKPGWRKQYRRASNPQFWGKFGKGGKTIEGARRAVKRLRRKRSRRNPRITKTDPKRPFLARPMYSSTKARRERASTKESAINKAKRLAARAGVIYIILDMRNGATLAKVVPQ